MIWTENKLPNPITGLDHSLRPVWDRLSLDDVLWGSIRHLRTCPIHGRYRGWGLCKLLYTLNRGGEPNLQLQQQLRETLQEK